MNVNVINIRLFRGCIAWIVYWLLVPKTCIWPSKTEVRYRSQNLIIVGTIHIMVNMSSYERVWISCIV